MALLHPLHKLRATAFERMQRKAHASLPRQRQKDLLVCSALPLILPFRPLPGGRPAHPPEAVLWGRLLWRYQHPVVRGMGGLSRATRLCVVDYTTSELRPESLTSACGTRPLRSKRLALAREQERCEQVFVCPAWHHCARFRIWCGSSAFACSSKSP